MRYGLRPEGQWKEYPSSMPRLPTDNTGGELSSNSGETYCLKGPTCMRTSLFTIIRPLAVLSSTVLSVGVASLAHQSGTSCRPIKSMLSRYQRANARARTAKMMQLRLRLQT